MGRIAGDAGTRAERDHARFRRSSIASARCSALSVVIIAVVMIVTILVVEHVRGPVGVSGRAHSGRCARRRGRAGGPARDRHRRPVHRRAADGAPERHRPSPQCRRNAWLGIGDRVGQDRHADQERDDRARGRHGQRSRDVRRDGVRADWRRAARRAGSRSRAIFGSNCERALAVADRANNAVLQQRDGRWTIQGDPTEGALIVAAQKGGRRSGTSGTALRPRIGEVPFSSERKIMSTVHTDAETAGAVAGLHEGRARCAARALHARTGRRSVACALTETRRREISGRERRPGRAAPYVRWPSRSVRRWTGR